MAPLTSGHVLAGVNCSATAPGTSPSAHVFKIDARGNTVADYRSGGLRPALFGSNEGYVTALVSMVDGEVIVAGFRPKPSGQAPGCFYAAAVAKLDARGEPVASFNGDSVLLLEGDFATDLGMDAAGWLYVGTMRRNSCSDHPPAGSVAAIYKISSN